MSARIGFYFRDENYGWLSNFHRSRQWVGNEIYETNEHYYQSQKAIGENLQKWIASAPNPYLAMKAGRLLRAGKPGELRADWDEIKLNIMLKGLRAKFKSPELEENLLATGDAYLYENSPTDKFWGGMLLDSKNHLGDLIMQVRNEIKSGKISNAKEKNLI